MAMSEHWLALFAGLISLKLYQRRVLLTIDISSALHIPDDLFYFYFFLNISYSLCTKPYLLLHLKIVNDLQTCFLEPTPRSYPSLPRILLSSSLGQIRLLAAQQTIFSRSPPVY